VHLPVFVRTAGWLLRSDIAHPAPGRLDPPSRAKDVLMPRYFIHLRNPDLWLEDCEGRHLPDLHAALKETQTANRSLPAALDGVYGLEFEITDSQGFTLLKVPVQWMQRPDALPVVYDGQEQGHSPSSAAILH
jgi:hypothetical protein